MFLIIGVWGGKRRIYASFKFFLYTLAGSLLMLIAILAMYAQTHTTDITVAAAHRVRSEPPEISLARLLRLLRGENADVAGPYLAARRPRRGADGGLGDPGRHPAEDGRLRLHPLLAADVPRRVALFRAAGLRPVDHRHRLHLAGRAGAGGHQEADRLFLGGAYGLRHHGPVRHEPAGGAGRGVPDGVARPRLRRALPLRRRGLRPAAHPRDRGLWRHCRRTCRSTPRPS